MTIKTLEELNREFIAENLNRKSLPAESFNIGVDEEDDFFSSDSSTRMLSGAQSRQDASPQRRRQSNSKRESKKTSLERKDLNISTETVKARPKKKKVRGALSISYWILFYVAILLVLFAVLTGSGYSFFNVTSAGATDEIPKGSFLLVHQTDPQDLMIGDNVTYRRDRNVTLIYEIGVIYEDYPDRGSRGFGLKDADDVNGSNKILFEENIIGKVIYTIPVIGTVISMLSDNIIIVIISVVLFIAIFLAFRKKQKDGSWVQNAE